MTNYLKMTTRDIEIKEILDKVLNNEITNVKAGELLWLWKRQIIRKKKKYKKEWISWIIHKSRWKKSNHKQDFSKYEDIIKLRIEKYSDYNVIHFKEKLEENHQIKISYWSLRNELIRNSLLKVKRRKIKQEFHKRSRKENYAEMLQYDWAYHKWLEDRNWWEELCLLVAVDDATWKVTANFDKSEWIIPTFNFWKEYIKNNWKPRAIYLDKFATYKINHPNATNDKELPTQFWRVCQTLWIQLIFANSPQWKWRVERMNETLEDRLVKELREANICNLNEANKFLKEIFLPKFNKRFTVEAIWESDLHIKLSKEELEHIDQIFSKHSVRKLKNDFTIAFNNKHYQLYRNKDWWWPHFNKWDIITVEEHLDWTIHLAKNWKYVVFKELLEKRRSWSYKLPMAPSNNSHFEEMKNEIDKMQEIDKIKNEKQVKEQNEVSEKIKLSYFERTWKEHPHNKCFKLWKTSPNFVKYSPWEQPARKT